MNSAASTCLARPRPTTSTTPAGPGRAAPLQGDQAPRLALRRHAQPMAVRWPAKIKPDATPRPQFHHCNDLVPTIYEVVGITPPLRGQRRSARSDRRREFRLHFRRPESQGPNAHPVLRDHGQPLHLPRWLDGLRSSARAPRGFPALRPASASGRRTRISGSSTTWRRTGRKRTTSPQRCRRSSPN